MMQMRSRECPVCQRPTSTTVWTDAHFNPEKLSGFSFASRKSPEFMHFRLVRCLECHVLFTHPAPTVQWLQDNYQSASFDAGNESRLAARSYARHIPSRILQSAVKAGALDIGSGDGAFLEQLLALGFTDVCGIEPSHAPIEQASEKIRLHLKNGVFTGTEVAASSQSLITCFQTLEHVDQPAELCRKAFRLLQPGGAFYAVVHNHRALSARILGTRSPIFDIEHLQLFDRRSLLKLFQLSGFEFIEIRSFCNHYPLSYWLRLFPLPAVIKQRILDILRFFSLENRSLSICPGNLSVVGYKPVLGYVDHVGKLHEKG